VDEAMDIADEPVASSADVQRNRLRTDTRLKITGWWNPEYSDKAKLEVSVDFGQLHLDALRRRALRTNTVPRLESGEADYEVLNDAGGE
jgi:hypothetical protein